MKICLLTIIYSFTFQLQIEPMALFNNFEHIKKGNKKYSNVLDKRKENVFVNKSCLKSYNPSIEGLELIWKKSEVTLEINKCTNMNKYLQLLPTVVLFKCKLLY